MNIPPEPLSPALVLDTNVLVSVLIYRDVRFAALQQSWAAGHFIVATNRPVSEEFARILRYPQFAARCSPEAVFDEYLARTRLVNRPVDRALAACRDPNDQMFLELACAAEAFALLTDDKQLLRMRRRMPFDIVRPLEWIKKRASA